MRRIYTIATLLVALLAIGACNNKSKTLYAISVDKDAVCSYAQQTLSINYRVHENVMNSDTKFTATCSESWVSVADTSHIGTVELKIEENNGPNRTAKITISAPGCVSTSVTLMQYGTPPEVANHTLMYCFFGTSLSRYFDTNLEDAVLAIESGILGNSNRVLFFRQESKNRAYIGELCYDIAGEKCIEQRIKDITLDDSSIITPETIGEYIAAMAEIAPAKRYGIVFAGHGQGWITRDIITSDKDIHALSMGGNPWIPAAGAEQTRAFGESNVQVNIDELAEGIEHSGVELDYILFDACFMSNIEAIYELRNSANYIIASPCEIMGKGFPYHRTLPYLFKNYGEQSDYEGATLSYYNYYKDEYTGSARCGSITLYKCSEIESLAEATREVMKSAKGADDYDTTTLQTYEGQKPHHFYDFGEWVNTIATDSEALKRFNTAMDECIVATHTLDTFYSAYGSYGTYPINRDVYSGVTTSAPSTAYPNGWRATNWYKEVIKLDI